MNTQSNAVPESSLDSQGVAPAAMLATRPFYWSVRRELWENRSIYIGPLVAAVLFLFGFVINMLSMRRSIGGSPLDAAQQHDLLATRYELSAALIMGTALIVGVFYSLDALYGERRDRSILFWKSLPVSDLTTVLSKLTIPLVILPLISFAITLATQFIMLLLSSVVLLGSGVNIAALWTEVSFFRVSVVLLYHLFTVHGLWYAPLYGWLLLVSAWAPRAPFIWAFLPPFVISVVERIAFNTSYFLELLRERLLGPEHVMPAHRVPEEFMATLIPDHFFSTPGLWTGLALAAVFLFVAVRLRRYRGPI
jgi:ABC-2 type transport system permease protein